MKWLFGGIVRGTLGGPIECFMELVNDRKALSLEKIALRRIHPDSFVCRDGWKGYVRLVEFFDRGIVNHTENFVNPADRRIHTQTVESMWVQLKRFLRDKCAFKRDKLELYINEFIFRKTYEDVFEEMFRILVKD